MSLCSTSSFAKKKKSLKHTKTYFFLFFCTLFAKNGLFAIWPPFLNRRLLINGSFLSIVTFHMVNVKRVVLWLLFRPYNCILHPRFRIRCQSHTVFFYCKGGSSFFIYVCLLLRTVPIRNCHVIRIPKMGLVLALRFLEAEIIHFLCFSPFWVFRSYFKQFSVASS